jgi:diguanylate cyclase (GGDEF)-like protein
MTDSTLGDSAATGIEVDAERPAPQQFQRWLGRLSAPTVLFPIIAILALGTSWLVTLNLVRVERDAGREAALLHTAELLDTYEVAAVRVLRDIDQTLRALQYAYGIRQDGATALTDLESQELLPPAPIFTTLVTDRAGRTMASNGQAASPEVLDPTLLRRIEKAGGLVEAVPVWSGEGLRLRFARSLAYEGSFAGVGLLEVDAEFFVNGYGSSDLGDRGILGLIGSDGVFRVRRTGDRVATGGRADYDAVVIDREFGDSEAALSTNIWDGVRRYTSARQLRGFPLAVVVGLAEAEQLAPAEAQRKIYLLRAAIGSVALILVLAALGRVSSKLETLRQREREAREAYTRRTEYLVYHDSLTGLFNRLCFNKLLRDRLRLAARSGRNFALLYLDLDRFKQINDTLGHEAGDDLLCEVAQRLADVLCRTDAVARIAGDEFLVLMPEIESEEMVGLVAQKVLSALKEPFVLLGETVSVTGSIGIALFPRDGSDEKTLIMKADNAMYQAKGAGKNAFRFFSEEGSTPVG